jgi:hypothetical protein
MLMTFVVQMVAIASLLTKLINIKLYATYTFEFKLKSLVSIGYWYMLVSFFHKYDNLKR